VISLVARQRPTGYHWLDCCAAAVDVYLSVLEEGGRYAGENRARLERSAARGCALLRRLSKNFWNVRARAELLHGRLYWYQGHHRRAQTAWTRAERIATEMGMEFDRALALELMGRHGVGKAALDGVERAADTFQRLGALVRLERLQSN
jgi:hypothetical protein